MKLKKNFLPQSLAAYSSAAWLNSLQLALRKSDSIITLTKESVLIDRKLHLLPELTPQTYAQLICYCMSVANRSKAQFSFTNKGYDLNGNCVAGINTEKRTVIVPATNKRAEYGERLTLREYVNKHHLVTDKTKE